MNIEKLASGSYRVRKMVNGKWYRITYETKPTQRQAEADLRELIMQDADAPGKGLAFEKAAKRYIDSKKNVLSPSTIRNYGMMLRNLPEWFISVELSDISQETLNRLVNELTLDKSPKTVRNYHGFVSVIIGTYRPQFKINTTLPQRKKIEPYIPTDAEVKSILDALKGSEFYIPIVLACYGMRRGEILALTADDVDGDVIHITKALSLNDKTEYVIKSTKTTESERDIIVPQDIADHIKAQGYAYNGYPNSINRHLLTVEAKLGIQPFPLHKLRHYFVSKMLTITDSKTVQALGGWKTDAVMKSVYAHSMKEEQEKAKRAAVDAFKDSIF